METSLGTVFNLLTISDMNAADEEQFSGCSIQKEEWVSDFSFVL